MPIPDIAFTKCANAAAAAFFNAPAYVVYRERARVRVPSLNRTNDVNRRVAVRTQKPDVKERAVAQDLPRGARTVLDHAFPLSPTFDAISYFRIYGGATLHSALEAYVEDVKPLTFAENAPASRADVVVQSLKYYYPKYADDSETAAQPNIHILLSPLPTLTNGNASSLYLHEVFCRPETYLPSRVVYTGPDDRLFAVDFETIEGHEVVKAARLEETFFAPLHIGRIHAIVTVDFDEYAFPNEPPEPELGRP